MKVTFDKNGYVNGWCMVGDNGGEEYDPPEENPTIWKRKKLHSEHAGKKNASPSSTGAGCGTRL